ncbi:patatin-like phospholipase family protein [Gemmata sp. G18]|uniref:Patatin-like phospholipase family protein n=1 Tax=Gemmata palustris TaxID=2822762 RepID=A0ABS5BTG2_9BACT|nr:cyclic nucleotide-binding and patatin-like phospholipase domain-containing protein [Gemmata palustris]MBP3957006.1 patatin-like phospholipase family protein [Gemmata palustris]
MNDDVIPLLKMHEYFRSASDEVLREVTSLARVTQHATGDVVHEANTPLTTVGFVLRGRLKAVRIDARGGESLFRMIGRGEQFGMMVGALTEPVPVRVVALEPTAVLNLDYEEAMELTFRHPDLRRLWLSTFTGSLRKHFFGAAPKRAPMVLALIHESPAARAVAEQLIARLRGLGEKLAIFSDSNDWQNLPDVPFRALRVDGRDVEPEEIRRQAAAWHDVNRIVFDLHADTKPERMSRLLEIADRAVYFVPASHSGAAAQRLRALDVPAHGWRDKIGIAWLLEGEDSVAPVTPGLHDLVARDFKIAGAPPKFPRGRALTAGLERLVHDLRGVRIGVALGGGAARGMSHLGILKALEDQGIVVDMIAGTSAGAMTGVVYASGLDCDYSANQFATALRPSWVFRRLPRGDHWYLLYKYRRGHFDPMLRKYLRDWHLEQLSVPCLTITVDLVSGAPVVRDRGDATHAVLESINLPVLSVPIVRGGQALIDGGLANNIPADVLVARGCNFVIAVSVTAKMEKAFCAITPDTRAHTGKKPSVLQTLLRSLLVQNHILNAQGVLPADVVIETDVRGFDLTAFTRSEEMAAIGRAAGLDAVPRIRQLLHRLDPQLFAPGG